MITLTIHVDDPGQLVDIWDHIREAPAITLDLSHHDDQANLVLTVDLTEPTEHPDDPEDDVDEDEDEELDDADGDTADEADPETETEGLHVVDWLPVTIDDRICSLIDRHPTKKWMARSIWEYLDETSENEIAGRLPVLARAGLITKVAQGVYQSTTETSDGGDAA